MTALIAIAVSALMLGVPTVAAQEGTYYSDPGDPAVYEDGKECFDAVGSTPGSPSLDGETCVVLYGHVFDLLNRVPINVQRPPSFAEDLSRGFTGTPGKEDLFNYNDFTLYSSPGFVEYNSANPGETPRLHPERGLSFDVELGQSIPLMGYWYMSADTDELSSAGGELPPGGEVDPHTGVMPCLAVRMVLQTGNYRGNGDIIAEGTVVKSVVSSMATQDTENPLAGQTTPCPNHSGAGDGAIDVGKVAEFKVPMELQGVDTINKASGFILFVEWWTFAPGNVDLQDKVYPREWNVHTGPEYIPRVVVPVENGVRVESVRPQFFDSKIFVHGVLNSPWGSYDVDPDSIEVKVFDESGAEVEVSNMEDPLLKYSVDHDGHFKPVNVTFPWDYQKDNLAPGTYTVTMQARNWQHTSAAEKSGTIIIAEDISKSVAEDSEGNTAVGDGGRNVESAESPAMSVFGLVAIGLLGLLGYRRLRL